MNNDKQAGANGISDAEIAGIMGWRGPGAYTEASLRKIKQILEEDRSRRALALSHAAPQIKTWQERMPDAVKWIGTASSEAPYKDAEIADLRAALACPPLPVGGTFSDEQIIAALHSQGIDTYPSKYGFDAVQVSATTVPGLRKVVETLATPAQEDNARDAALDLVRSVISDGYLSDTNTARGRSILDRAAMSRNNGKGGE